MIKKIVFSLAVLGFASTASAYSLLPSSHPVYGGKDGLEIIGYISNSDWDKEVAEKQERDHAKLPIISEGVDLTDEGGVVYKNACSNAGMGKFNCVDLTHTKKYHDDMVNLARSLFGQESAYPVFAGWFKIAKSN